MELEFYHILHCLNPNLVASIIISPTGLFSVNCSKTAFCILHFSISDLPQSPDIGQNSDWGISDFRISGQSLKRNCHSSRTSGDIDMKLGTVTKIDTRSKALSQKRLTMMSYRKIVT